VDYFRGFVGRSGEPALDVACGAGRLLVPFRLAGLDVDGCDVSADMVAACRRKLEEAGVAADVWAQPMHELDPPRTYRTIFVCGGFGLGSTHAHDEQALRRFHAALVPGGTLVLDVEMPYSYTRHWPYWLKDGRGGLPEDWREPDRRRTADGRELALATRVVDLDPLEQLVTMELRAEQWAGGERVAAETHTLTIRLYFRDELAAMVRAAGFEELEIFAGNTLQAPTPDDDFLVFAARRA
jgi:SAM-dependent methyltransferase